MLIPNFVARMSEATSQSRARVEDLIGDYFLDLWSYTSKTLALNPETDDEEEEEMPMELDTLKSSGGFSVVGPDKLSLLYPNVSLHGYDVGVVQANCPAPMKRMLYYFEINVKNSGEKGQIAIGFTTSAFKVRRQPGWEPNSCGYHGDDGFVYFGNVKGRAFGPTYSTGDTVGCGINYTMQEFFFTKNEDLVGCVYKTFEGPLFPTVSVHSQNEEITVNFGQDPFVFDLRSYEADRRDDVQFRFDDISIPLDASYWLVRSYLQHYGYEETLKRLDIAGSTVPNISLVPENGVMQEEESVYALNERSCLRQLIQSGKIDETFSILGKWYPQIIEDGKLEEVVFYGRRELDKFKKSAAFDDLVKDCAALLAYEQPGESSVGYLLGESQRELVADAVNATILSTNPNIKESSLCLHSSLDTVVRQVTACFLVRRSRIWDEGEAFRLSRMLRIGKEG